MAAVSRAPPLPAAAVIRSIVPWRALISVLFGICVTSVSGTNLPLISTSTVPVTGWMLKLWPSVGGAGSRKGLAS